MKKLSILTVVASVIIFSASLAVAGTQNIPVCTQASKSSPMVCGGQGTINMLANGASSLIQVQDVVLTLTNVSPTPGMGEPANFWTGTLRFPSNPPSGTSSIFAGLTVNLSSLKDPWFSEDPHYFHDIAGANASTNPVAANTLTLIADGWSNGHAANPNGQSTKPVPCFFLRGKIFDGSTFIGTFKGLFFPQAS